MTFLMHVEKVVSTLVENLLPLEAVGVDVDDIDDTSLTLRLPDGRTYVLGPYAPAEQLWVSSPISGGRHFVFEEGIWKDTRGGKDLMALLQEELHDFYKRI